MLRGVVLLASPGALLLACQANPGLMNGEPSLRDASITRRTDRRGTAPSRGCRNAQAAAIFIRNRPALLRLPGVTKVTLSGLGILVQTEQPDRLPAEVEGLPVLDIQDGVRIAQGIPLGDAPTPATAALCQTLPEKSSSADVALYVAKAPDRSGIVCVRGDQRHERKGSAVERRHFGCKKKEASTWRDAVFPDAPPTAATPGSFVLQAGGNLDGRLPGFGRTASPGLYRACFSVLVSGAE